MDRSVDSIGSCSLDVDADSTDISDTSGSLNFPTPISVKDVTREFTTNIRERCTANTLCEFEKGPAVSETQMILKQPTGRNTSSILLNSATVSTSMNLTDPNLEKKPSYLNLACCVNGYSNLTTYDSKIRQDINKSREVSPIRPSSHSIQYCKMNNSLAPPVLHSMPIESNGNKNEFLNGQYKATNHNYNPQENNNINHVEDYDFPVKNERRSTSFIQQRVERLYGPAALAQGFYSPKKVRSGTYTHTVVRETDNDTSELTRKFQQLTPSKDYSEFRKKLYATTSNSTRQVVSSSDISNLSNNDVDLPVLRHLSQEFRAQLPIISPKKSNIYLTPIEITDKEAKVMDEVDHKVSSKSESELVSEHAANGDLTHQISQSKANNPSLAKDGTYFLELHKIEQNRLLALANDAEKYIDVLSKTPDVSEDVLGFLRSASGKARLLVSQKMKQFEGLCQNNLKSSPEDKFPTTVDDLQGFWDMVNLQIDHINSIFSEIEILKNNNWKKSDDVPAQSKVNKPQLKSNKTVNQKMKPDPSKGNESISNPSAKSAAALKRESQRKMLQDIKRRNKIALIAKSTTSGPEILESRPENLSPIEIFVRHNNCPVSK